MAEVKHVPSNLIEFVHPKTLDMVCDMYVFGTQESTSNKSVPSPHNLTVYLLFHNYRMIIVMYMCVLQTRVAVESAGNARTAVRLVSHGRVRCSQPQRLPQSRPHLVLLK